jgi:metallophosphoesterase superfamily enzyme
MSINILCIGDIHIQINNTIDIKIFTEKLYEYIKNNYKRIDIIVLMGDILHTHERLHTIPFNIANVMIEQLSKIKPLYILVGNHDFHYMPICDEKYSGYQKALWPEIGKVLETNKHHLRMAYRCDDLVFSHAGITPEFLLNNNLLF